MSNGSVSAGCTNGNTNGKSEWPIPPYSRPKFTSTDLDWAPLITIDISNFEKPERRRELAKELESAVNEVGFFVVVGHGITDEEVLRQLAIANAFFHLPMEEKVKVPIDLENYHKFSFQINDPQSTHLIAYNSWGYREPKRKLGDSGYIEAVETYEVHKDIPELSQVPVHPFIAAHWDEIGPFGRKMHDRIIRPLLVLISLILELPEDHFSNLAAYEKRSEDWMRWMLNSPRDKHFYEVASKFGVDSDSDGITALFEQNIACLYADLVTCSGLGLSKVNREMLTTDGKWKRVKPVRGGVTINCGALMAQITKKYIKATIHRVAPPPEDQYGQERLGLLYFACFNDQVELRPVDSPKLRRLGIVIDEDFDPAKEYPTSQEYTRSLIRARHHFKSYGERKVEQPFELKGLTQQFHHD